MYPHGYTVAYSYHSTYHKLCVGRSLGKEVDIGGHVSEFPPVVVVAGGIDAHTEHYIG